MDHDPAKLQTLQQKRDELYQDARAHPGSEAEEIVKAFLLSGISHMQPELENEESGFDLGEARRRFDFAREQQAQKAGARATPAVHQQVKLTVGESETKLRAVVEAAAAASDSAAAGKPMDPQEVYNRIFEIVGLSAPSKPERDPEQEQKSGTEWTGDSDQIQ